MAPRSPFLSRAAAQFLKNAVPSQAVHTAKLHTRLRMYLDLEGCNKASFTVARGHRGTITSKLHTVDVVFLSTISDIEAKR